MSPARNCNGPAAFLVVIAMIGILLALLVPDPADQRK